jgi:long-chain acyl-CoA synthetase
VSREQQREKDMASIYEQRPWLHLYSDWVKPDLEIPAQSGLEMFKRTATQTPDAPAIHYFENTLTFADVDRASDALAAALAEHGVGRGDRVGVYMQNVPQFPIAMLAIWKVGAILVALNPMLKGKEVNYHLSDSGSKALIALESLYSDVREDVESTDVKYVITTSELDFLGDSEPGPPIAQSKRSRPAGTDDFAELVEKYAGRSVPDPGLGHDDVAILVYTSGTTGRPKGAMNTHGNVVFNSEAYRVWMKMGPDEVILGAAPLFHVTGLIAHVTLGWRAGVPLVLFFRFEPGEALRMVERWKCTFTVAAITAYQALMAHDDIKTRDLSSFKKLYSGGAPIAPATVERYEQLGGAYIHNVYGLTETTSPSHGVPLGVRSPVDTDSGALSVGIPFPNTIVRIVDVDSREELPPGEIGELWTQGPQVVAGYWQRPEATAESFTDGHYLHTGDVGKMDGEGWFYIVDRSKDMINAGGYKVWPREVEDYLYQHPAVREASVVGVPDPYRGETVKAFVALHPGATATAEEILEFAKNAMATYKRPREVEIVDDIPKTVTGKYLRRELRERERIKASAAAAQGKPQGSA